MLVLTCRLLRELTSLRPVKSEQKLYLYGRSWTGLVYFRLVSHQNLKINSRYYSIAELLHLHECSIQFQSQQVQELGQAFTQTPSY